MSLQFDVAKQIIGETCPNRKLKLENIRLFADIIQPKKYQKGDIILNDGDICNCLFYIENGFTEIDATRIQGIKDTEWMLAQQRARRFSHNGRLRLSHRFL